MGKSKVFIIVDVAFDYNDEINSSVEGEAGEPVKAFRHKEKAESFCHKANIDRIKGLDLADYCYDLSDIVKETDKFLELIHGKKQEPAPQVLESVCTSWCKRKFADGELFCAKCGRQRGSENKDDDDDRESLTVPSNISDIQAAQIYDLLNLTFYRVVEVEAG